MTGWLAATPLAAAALYLLCAVVLGMSPVNRDYVPASGENTVAVYLRTNGVHAEFVLPVQGVHDWTREFPPWSMLDVARTPSVLTHRWLAFGWGDRDFMVSTPTFSDLRSGTSWRALTGQGEGALYVQVVEQPAAYEGRWLQLSEPQYRQLVQYITDEIVRGADGRPRRLAAQGWFGNDAFFAAQSVYTFWFTCNEWIRRGLAQAGVRTARWAPFERALFWQLDRIESSVPSPPDPAAVRQDPRAPR